MSNNCFRMLLAVPMMLFVQPPPVFAANEYLTSITSPVYPFEGEKDVTIARARTCMAQILASGVQGGQLIVSDGAGVIVANNVLSYPDGLMDWKLRSKLTFEARDGRFRIEQTAIERFNSSWGGVGKWSGSGWKKAEAALMAVSTRLANCILSKNSKSDW